MDASIVTQVGINGLQASAVYILVTLGLTLIFGVLGIVNFAHGQFYMLGCFGVYCLFSVLELPYFLAVVFSILLVGVVSAVIEGLVFRPVLGNEMACLIVSLGVLVILPNLALKVFGIVDKDIPTWIPGSIKLFGAFLTYEKLAIIVGCFCFIIAVFFLLNYTKLGKAMKAVGQNKTAAVLQGIDADRINMVGFIIGCGLAAAAGAIISPIGYTNPSIGMEPTTKAFIVMVLGGMGSIPGAVIGGVILGFMEAITQHFVSSTWAILIAFVIVVVILIVKPEGLIGHD